MSIKLSSSEIDKMYEFFSTKPTKEEFKQKYGINDANKYVIYKIPEANIRGLILRETYERMRGKLKLGGSYEYYTMTYGEIKKLTLTEGKIKFCDNSERVEGFIKARGYELDDYIFDDSAIDEI